MYCDEVACRPAPDAGVAAPTLVLRVAYDGAPYAGFALQEKQRHVRTVAGELKAALGVLLRRDVEIVCAGRTDAGVHARAQYVSVALEPGEERGIQAARLLRSFGAILPPDIVVSEVLRAPSGFSARFDAQARRYRYRIAVGGVRPLFSAHWAWWIRAGELDVGAMARAAAHLVGEHDFKSFCKASSAEGKPTCRCIESLELCEEEEFGERLLVVDVVGNAFLHSMVRTMVGTLVEVGSGRRDPSWVGRVLEACDRRAAGPCAPACGLTFWDVRYPQGLLRPW